MKHAHRIEAAGVSLHVDERGVGSPVLLLHGFTGSTRSLDPVARGLADRHHCVSIDLVGHGLSEAPDDASAYEMEACARQLDAVCERLALGAVQVLGYSMGGRAALALLALYPARIRAALVVGACAGLEDPRARAARVRDDEALAARIEREGVAPFVDHWMSLPLFASQLERLPAPVLAAARDERLANRAAGLAGSLRGMGTGAQPPLHAALARTTRPVALTVGAEDTKFHKIARELAQRMPRASVFTVPHAGHAPHLENPQAFLRIARAFFAVQPPQHTAVATP